jgi:hypothetical protein
VPDPSLRQNPNTKQARRHVSRDVWAALASAAARQRDALPADSPRRRPSLPRLRFLELPDAAIGGAGTLSVVSEYLGAETIDNDTSTAPGVFEEGAS